MKKTILIIVLVILALGVFGVDAAFAQMARLHLADMVP